MLAYTPGKLAVLPAAVMAAAASLCGRKGFISEKKCDYFKNYFKTKLALAQSDHARGPRTWRRARKEGHLHRLAILGEACDQKGARAAVTFNAGR